MLKKNLHPMKYRLQLGNCLVLDPDIDEENEGSLDSLVPHNELATLNLQYHAALHLIQVDKVYLK